MRIVAFMPVYNEDDILEASVARLARNGVITHILDNWSTDESWSIARQLQARGVATAERIPGHGPEDTYDLVLIRDRIAELAAASDAEWCMWNDADEFMHPPRNLTIAAALQEAAAEGFTAVEQLVAIFPPVDNSYKAGSDFVAHFRYWRPQPQVGTRPWVRIWRNTGAALTFRGGNHEVDFDGRRLDPMPFILRHYPLRSQQHAERKIFRERRPRYSSAARARGWHTHYDDARITRSFLENPAALNVLDEGTFAAQVFAAAGRERLS
jgi:glycosyltransferase involved in cell wall biosynthesis